MVFVYEVPGFVVLAAENPKEESDLVDFAWPEDTWVRMNKSVVYIRDSELHRGQPSANTVSDECLRSCAAILKHRSNLKRDKISIEYTVASNVSKNGPINRQKVSELTCKPAPWQGSSKQERIDLQSARDSHEKLLKQRNNSAYKLQKQETSARNQEFQQMAELNRKGYSDLYEGAEVQEFDEDDFM